MKSSTFLIFLTAYTLLGCDTKSNVSVRKSLGKEATQSGGGYTAAFADSPYCEDGNLEENLPVTSDSPSFNIVGGVEVSAGNLVSKSTVKIHMNGNTHCTGTLIGPRHIVTAAHCFNLTKDPSSLRIGTDVRGVETRNVLVEKLTIHPRYTSINRNPVTKEYVDENFYDIAIIVLSAELSGMKPVGMGDSGSLVAGSQVLLAGYGGFTDEDLQNGIERPLAAVFTKVKSVNDDFQDIQLSTAENIGPCSGDSGGPLFLKHPDKQCLVLLGSVTGYSRGKWRSCADGGGTITDVSTFQGWLKCSFEDAGAPLAHLKDDGSSIHCPN